jgi:hypothetical protein
MDIRAGKSIKPIQGNEVIVSHKDELNTGMLQWADQVICATNATRVALNTQMRQLSGLNNLKPQNGDKIVCLRNYWDSFSDDGEDPLINGTIGWIDNCFTTFIQLPRWAEGQQIPILNCNFKTDSSSIFSSLDMDRDMIITGESSLNWKTSFKLSKNPKTRLLVPKQFTYGYAITCHKAQGSEFEKVLVVEEKFPFDREEHARWLYTAATRASEKLVIIQKD